MAATPTAESDRITVEPVAEELPARKKSHERLPYLDGLRAVAILSVLIGHSQIGDLFPKFLHVPFEILGNGTTGVRIFFVISGFLITTLLLNEMEDSGTISIPAFYKRRVARIFPAFYCYIAFIVALILLGYLPPGWAQVVAASTFTWNYGHLWLPTTVAGIGALGHIWTLSLEEQFYLVWPATLKRLRPERALRVVLPIIVLLPFVRVATYFALPPWRGQLMMMFHTAIDTILVGAAVALMRRQGTPPSLRKVIASPLTGPICIAVVAVQSILLRNIRGMPVFLAPSIDCVSTGLLIWWLLDRPKNRIGSFLLFPPLAWIGLISYSLYLWQEPFTLPSPVHLAAPWSILASFAAAVVSYYVIERPARAAIRRRWGS